jgi:hypothetical protein
MNPLEKRLQKLEEEAGLIKEAPFKVAWGQETEEELKALHEQAKAGLIKLMVIDWVGGQNDKS